MQGTSFGLKCRWSCECVLPTTNIATGTYLCWEEVLAVLLGVHLLLDELVAHGLVVIHLESLAS